MPTIWRRVGVFWLGLWTGTFSKHHRPQGAARGYWLHGKGRGPRGRDGEHRPTQNHRGAMQGMIDNKPNLNLCLFQDTTAVFGQFVPQRRFFQIRGRMWKTVQDSVRFLKKTVSKIDTSFDVSPPCPQNHHFPHFLGAGWRGVRNFGLIRKNISKMICWM